MLVWLHQPYPLILILSWSFVGQAVSPVMVFRNMATERKFRAHPQSAPGDFYVVNGECINCGAPHAVAPDLIGWADSGDSHCIWKKQPEDARRIRTGLRRIRCVRNLRLSICRHRSDDYFPHRIGVLATIRRATLGSKAHPIAGAFDNHDRSQGAFDYDSTLF